MMDVFSDSVATAIPTDVCAWNEDHPLDVQVVIWRESIELMGRSFATVFCSLECEEWYMQMYQPM